MPTVTGRMATERPERYAKQLFSHWSERGEQSHELMDLRVACLGQRSVGIHRQEGAQVAVRLDGCQVLLRQVMELMYSSRGTRSAASAVRVGCR